MALNSRSAIDPRWFYHNSPVGYGLQVAKVKLYQSNDYSKVYDAETNSWSGSNTDIYIGPARIQQISTASDAGEDFSPTMIQTVRVQLPYNKNTLGGNMPDIRPNMMMRVTSSPYNSSLESFLFEVISVLNSSNSWERTIICRADSELDPANE